MVRISTLRISSSSVCDGARRNLGSHCDPDSLLEAFRCSCKFCVSFGLDGAQRLGQDQAHTVCPLWASLLRSFSTCPLASLESKPRRWCTDVSATFANRLVYEALTISLRLFTKGGWKSSQVDGRCNATIS